MSNIQDTHTIGGRLETDWPLRDAQEYLNRGWEIVKVYHESYQQTEAEKVQHVCKGERKTDNHLVERPTGDTVNEQKQAKAVVIGRPEGVPRRVIRDGEHEWVVLEDER